MTGKEVEILRQNIHQDFDGTVLRDERIPDPPVRGRYGYAYLPLKEAATQHRQKPFSQHCEAQEAIIKIVNEWAERKFIERPTGPVEWLAQAFAVPKKSPTFPWRGVVDMRGPNSQTRKGNYPLPNIENILVKQGRNQIFFHFGPAASFSPAALTPQKVDP